MPTYEYKCEECGSVAEVVHGISQDALIEFDCPACKSRKPCHRIVSTNSCGFVLEGTGWTVKSSGFGARGYTGKFQDNIRPIGTPVDAPVHKAEADRQFQKYIDSGGLDGIKPTFDVTDKNDPRRPKSGQEMIDG